jgi:hypothetical protein
MSEGFDVGPDWVVSSRERQTLYQPALLDRDYTFLLNTITLLSREM